MLARKVHMALASPTPHQRWYNKITFTITRIWSSFFPNLFNHIGQGAISDGVAAAACQLEERPRTMVDLRAVSTWLLICSGAWFVYLWFPTLTQHGPHLEFEVNFSLICCWLCWTVRLGWTCFCSICAGEKLEFLCQSWVHSQSTAGRICNAQLTVLEAHGFVAWIAAYNIFYIVCW